MHQAATRGRDKRYNAPIAGNDAARPDRARKRKVQSRDEYERPRDEQDAVPFDDPLMSINPEIAGRIRGGRFVSGVSGSPAAKPPGARARATRLAEKLMAGDAEAVIRAVIEAAKGGDMTAAKIILDRIAPLCRGRRVRLNLPPIVGAADLLWALSGLVIPRLTCELR